MRTPYYESTIHRQIREKRENRKDRIKEDLMRYGSDVLKNLSLHANRGEFIAVLGGNGAGKSTLLSVINGLLKAYSGKINIAVSRIATLPQNPQLLLSGKTVLDSLKEMRGSEERLSQVMRPNALHSQKYLSQNPK